MIRRHTIATALIAFCAVSAMAAKPVVHLETSKGVIVIELDSAKAPITVANFIGYVQQGFYNGTIFHRVIPQFMIQGGGFTPDMSEKPTKAPIQNEAYNGLKNLRGTIAMARTSDPHSASAQFFFNTKMNDFLDFKAKTEDGFGYCVFGKVIRGMDVVEAIEKVATTTKGPYGDVPVTPVSINKAYVVASAAVNPEPKAAETKPAATTPAQ
jgi:cyclophilin family peptidyl-prolyl cis-trans isomerase